MGQLYKTNQGRQSVVFFLLLCFLSNSQIFAELGAPEKGCDCDASQEFSADGPSYNRKLANPEKIMKGFEEGQDKVKVIIKLVEPQAIKTTTKWNSKQSLNKLHSKVQTIQSRTLSKFSPDEFKLRHRFENQASFSGEVTAETLEKLVNDPCVVSIEPVYIVKKHVVEGISLINGTVYRSIYNGQGVAIAICDTGIDYTHPKLGNDSFPNSKVIGGYDFGNDDSDPFPNSNSAHGTCCAGIAAGDIGTGSYIGGVAHGAKLYALKVENSLGTIYSDKVAAAWDWCVSHKNDDPCNPILVISSSLGSDRYYSTCDGSESTYATAANDAVTAGITLLASSGNEGYCNSLSAPACISNIISVGAVYDASLGTISTCVNDGSCAISGGNANCAPDEYSASQTTAADIVAVYSNTASFLDVLAPSNNAYTTDISGSNGYSTGDYYSSFGGTSAACPYTAGAAACLQSAAKDCTGSYLTPSEIRSILTSTGDYITDDKVAITKPRINLGQAINTILTLNGCLLNAPVLQAEPNITPGLCNTIFWDAAAEANEYYAEYSIDPYFSAIEGNSGWITDTNYEFCGLSSRETYWYRVKATSNETESDWSNTEYSRQCGTGGDFEPDCDVDWDDLDLFTLYWLDTDCNGIAGNQTDWCFGTDIDRDGNTVFHDFAILANNWFEGVCQYFYEDFNDGLPSEEWDYYSSGPAGRIQVINGRLRMDKASGSNFVLNEAILHLDLEGWNNVTLEFFQAESGDEKHTLPSVFTGHYDGDGVSVSNDGTTWYQVVNATQLDVGTTGKTFTVNLDDAGIAYTSDFMIKFQQYDNSMWSSDGREFDNIEVTICNN